MASGKRLIGMEITDDQLKLAEIVRKKQGTMVTKFTIEDIPAGLLLNGVIQDKEAFRSYLKQLKRKLKVSGKVNLAINSPNILLRPIQLPKMNQKRLHQAIDMEITNNIQLPFQGYTYDYAWIPKAEVAQEYGIELTEQEKEQKQEMMLVIGSKEMLDTYVELLQKVGLEVIGIDLAPLSFLKVMEFNTGNAIHPLFLGVNLHKHFAEISVFSDGVVRLSRNVMINAQNYMMEIEEDGVTTSALNTSAYATDLMREVERILNFYRYTLNHREQVLQEIVVAGEVLVQNEQIEEPFSTFFQAPVTILQVNALIAHKNVIDSYPTQAHRLTIPIGLALKDVRKR